MNDERKVTAALDQAIGWTTVGLLGLLGMTTAIAGLARLRRHRNDDRRSGLSSVAEFPYIRQSRKRGGGCCVLIGMLNALRFYGINTPGQNTGWWDCMVDIFGCRYGSVIGAERNAAVLGLRLVPVTLREVPRRLPVLFNFYSREVGFHAALVVHTEGDIWTVVNYRSHRGQTLEKVDVRTIEFPPPHVCARWQVVFYD